jgi:hypothetical protein
MFFIAAKALGRGFDGGKPLFKNNYSLLMILAA